MKIAVFGLGYVGMTTAACLARQGHEVVGVDVSDEKVAIVNAGKSPITEPGLDQLVERAVGKSLLSATKDASGHLDSCTMATVCVGTPVRRTTFTGRVDDATLFTILSTADVCVNPDRPSSMNDKSTMHKIMESLIHKVTQPALLHSGEGWKPLNLCPLH